MADNPTGVNLANEPAMPGSNPQPANATVPAFWNDPKLVLERVFAIAAYDPQSAGEIWREYRKLTGL